MNRRIFIQRSIYGSISLLTFEMLACRKDSSGSNPARQPAHPPIDPRPGMDLYGSIIDDAGHPVAGAVVSDGYQCVLTDDSGIYQMKRDTRASTVFFSMPEQYEVKTAGAISGAADFFSPLSAVSGRYNFDLKKLPAVENDFTLICIGDPQVTSAAEIDRYKAETVTDMKAFIETQSRPCYALVLGDTVNDRPEFFTQMRNVTGALSMPCFTTIGNHDKTGGSAASPRDAAAYTAVFGPVNYSWNRGKVHFISLDNVLYADASTYRGGLEDFQIEWLRQDLSHVPKDKMIIVYYHIPIRHTTDFPNRAAFFSLLEGYAGVHFMAGHTHYNENFAITSPMNIYEHIHGAACGAWWKSTVNCDGTPNGYAVYSIHNAEINDWFYKSTRYGKDFQIRMHWGDTQFGGPHGHFSYQQGYNIVANIWNADPEWTIEAFEDGVNAGVPVKLSTLIDAYAAGYHVGVLNRVPGNYGAAGNGSNKHAYLHVLKNKSAREIEIRATDRFGHVYSQTEIIADLTAAEKY
ncbi:MAG: calcineurin-like phosphoesterase family protein [Tannerella sp.]|jgi:hypothetical protein|nr:calcineurin-like phosphoesterase family protein [Tannerella sp.]